MPSVQREQPPASRKPTNPDSMELSLCPRASDREIIAARKVAEAFVEFLVTWDEGRRLRTPVPTKSGIESKPIESPPISVPKPNPSKNLEPPLDSPGRLISVDKVADLLECSRRHVYRLADCGWLPRPRKVGNLSRWSVDEIGKWVEEGCPKQRGNR